MSEHIKVDYIIVGQGLAGSAVAVQLLTRQRKIVVIDRQEPETSSRVAAGLFNPVTGKFLSKTWMADVLFSTLQPFYKSVEEKTGSRFLHSLPIYIPFHTVAEQNEWMARSVDEAMASVIADVRRTPRSDGLVNDPHGGILLKQCGYLDTTTYLEQVKRWIQEDSYYLQEDFDEGQLTVDEEGVSYKGFSASRIIYCQGEQSTRSRFFSWVPIVPLKGETIAVKGQLPDDVIVNRGVFVVPAGDATWRVGATYDRHFQTRAITKAGLEELSDKLKQLVRTPYTVCAQNAGIRPTSPNRRPVLGAHPDYPPVIIFNGLGTKGVSLAPYFSDVLVRWMENDGVLNDEVDISRYKSLYWKSR